MKNVVQENEFTTVVALDEKGSGGARHIYAVDNNSICVGDETPERYACISFQKGAIKENGINGCTNEDLLAVVVDRLKCFQDGDFKCRENAVALTHIETALLWLNKRTLDRKRRGVEGRSIA